MLTQNDLTFFTNEPGQKLEDRFKRTLKDVQYFDILVGYFRTSGFHKLYQEFESIDKMEIYWENNFASSSPNNSFNSFTALIPSSLKR